MRLRRLEPISSVVVQHILPPLGVLEYLALGPVCESSIADP